jgi:hypothetical protein
LMMQVSQVEWRPPMHARPVRKKLPTVILERHVKGLIEVP